MNGVCDFIVEKGLSCGVMLSYFVLRGLARAGKYREVYDLLTNDSIHGWGNMLKEGATSCFEAWGKDQKHNTSLCHPWASAPISILIEEIAGIKPNPDVQGGYRKEPHISEELRLFELTEPWTATWEKKLNGT